MQKLRRKKLLLYVSRANYPGNAAIASTLAWLSKSKNYLFDTYYDSYHQGVHFPGGDFRKLETGQLTGGTVPADRHFEELYFLLLNFDVSVISLRDTMFLSVIKHFSVPVVAEPRQANVLYKKAFSYFEVPLPTSIVIVGSSFSKALTGLEAYLYPEIYYRRAIGVSDNIAEDEIADLYQVGGMIFSLYADRNVVSSLRERGFDIEVIDQLKEEDDYFSITRRIALRWKAMAEGWILGDPMLVSHWLPKACEENLLSIYSIPQEKIVSELEDIISCKGSVVYGRQYSDKDFFQLSRLGQCLQVIVPCRPPFQCVKHVDYTWHMNQNPEGFYYPEYTDAELRQFASEGRIMVSLMFWSGMIREIANFYNLMDLFAICQLRCGLVLTAQSFEYMMHSPLELLTIPTEQGGVYPLIEPVLGSCGIGVGIESYIEPHRLRESLRDALSRILRKVKKQNYLPRGWWATMDTDLEKLPWHKRPRPIRFLRYSPYFQIRFNAREKRYRASSSSKHQNISDAITHNVTKRMKATLQKAGLTKYFEPYRPYEFYRAGTIRKDVIEAAQSVGLKYMLTKAKFNSDPQAIHLDNNFAVLNYTSGQWDGWTPFETINDVSDLRRSERNLLKQRKPGWILSTIDSCLWTFSGEFWKKGSNLYEIAQFCAKGGSTGELINVKPFTIARYARIISENI